MANPIQEGFEIMIRVYFLKDRWIVDSLYPYNFWDFRNLSSFQCSVQIGFTIHMLSAYRIPEWHAISGLLANITLWNENDDARSSLGSLKLLLHRDHTKQNSTLVILLILTLTLNNLNSRLITFALTLTLKNLSLTAVSFLCRAHTEKVFW